MGNVALFMSKPKKRFYIHSSTDIIYEACGNRMGFDVIIYNGTYLPVCEGVRCVRTNVFWDSID